MAARCRAKVHCAAQEHRPADSSESKPDGTENCTDPHQPESMPRPLLMQTRFCHYSAPAVAALPPRPPPVFARLGGACDSGDRINRTHSEAGTKELEIWNMMNSLLRIKADAERDWSKRKVRLATILPDALLSTARIGSV